MLLRAGRTRPPGGSPSAAPLGYILSAGPEAYIRPARPHPFVGQITGKPVLGICYGMQLLAHELGGRVDASARHDMARQSAVVSRRCPAPGRAFRWRCVLDEPRRPVIDHRVDLRAAGGDAHFDGDSWVIRPAASAASSSITRCSTPQGRNLLRVVLDVCGCRPGLDRSQRDRGQPDGLESEMPASCGRAEAWTRPCCRGPGAPARSATGWR